MEKSDAKLVRQCLNGDARAWELLVNSIYSKIYNMAYQYTGRFDLAEELAQDILLKVHRNLGSFRPESGSIRNWVMRVGRNLLIDNYRATRKDRNVAGSEELEKVDFHHKSSTPSPFENLHQKEQAEFLMTGLDQLTHELKEAVLLRDLQGLAYQEIAGLLDIPEGTVKSRINRGRIELAKTLRRMRPAEAVLEP